MNCLAVVVVALLAVLSAELTESRKLSQAAAAGYDESAARVYAQDVMSNNIPAAAHGLESATGSQLAHDIFAAVNFTDYTESDTFTNKTIANAIAQSLKKANVSMKDQVTAFGSALARFLNAPSATQSSLTSEKFDTLNHAFNVLDAAFSAGLSQSFDDIFAQAKSQLAPSMKTVAAVIKMFELGEVDDTPTAVQGTKAASDTFGATSSSLSRSAGNASDAGQLLFISAVFGVQAGGNSGPDNHAHSSNDVQQAQALSLTINKSTLAPAEVSSSLSQAIAAAMESAMESTIRYESAALLIATANTVNVSAAVPLVAQAFRQAHDNGVAFDDYVASFCQVGFAAMDISPATANTTTAALLAAFGQDQVSEFMKDEKCRRYPHIVG